MAPWLQFLEAWMVQQLLRTPGFHRLAERAARNVHRIRNGLPKDSGEGGTRLDSQQNPEFLKHFMDELKTQLGQAESQQGSKTALKTTAQTNTRQAQQPPKEPEGAHEVWEHTKTSVRGSDGGRQQQQGFMGEYIDALREQINSGKSRR
ncbi:hypothetical protein K431DRAFT_292452 [Polychaeton citri CBS 116435]|uniref:Uncharacterized protein n=1 Tax=Polychaeton citri CBS 116435 TaxID=1314669 RepID=A0A9P4US46_9PEZI|nr:hypothetical protein K431DRAFT_292452 [Polychaeton citri CBS 116435]